MSCWPQCRTSDAGVAGCPLRCVHETGCSLYMKQVVLCTCHTLFHLHETLCFLYMKQVVFPIGNTLFHLHETHCDAWHLFFGSARRMAGMCFKAFFCGHILKSRSSTMAERLFNMHVCRMCQCSQSSVRMPTVLLGCRKAMFSCSAPLRGALSMRRMPASSASFRALATPSSTQKAMWCMP